MILSVLKFSNLSAKDIMTPRINVYMLNIDCNLENEIDEIFENKYSRIPVYQNNKDNIVGIINIKDLTEGIIKKGIKNLKLTDIMRKPLFNRDLIKINKLFEQMKNTKNHISILINEFGETSGIVTMEDIIEEIFGNIEDEFDDEINLVKINDSEFFVNGATPIQEINRELGTSFDENHPDYDTIGGLIISKLDLVPLGGETVQLSNIKLIVERVEEHRIIRVRLIINE
jgi:putative hemolysin